MRVVSFMRHVSALWLSLALASVEARAQSGDEALIGIWAAEKTFAAALAGPLECVFSDGRGQFRGTSSGDKDSIAGWWLRPSGETEDRNDPVGSGQPFATRVDLEPRRRQNHPGDPQIAQRAACAGEIRRATSAA